VSRENMPMRKGLQRRDGRTFQRFSARQNGKMGVLARMLDPLRAIFGDPDGRKARQAGERGRKVQPLDAGRRLNNYAQQDGGIVRLTPARRRRISHKAGHVGDLRTRAAYSRGGVAA
jgi:hypothetical protein